MPLIKITPPPGIKKNGTDYSNPNSWIDGNLVRFENGFLKNIGGWRKLKDTPLDGTPIGAYAYRTNEPSDVLAVGTREKVYVLYRNQWYNITPVGFSNDKGNSPLGFGAHIYGQENFGDARSTSGLLFNTQPFAFTNFGELLLFVSGSDGKVYQWSPQGGGNHSTPDTIATQVTNSPTNASGVLVTNERHVLCFGAANNPRKISWSSRETLTDWTPTATNSAGDLEVVTGGEVLGGVKYGTDVIVFTDVGINKVYYTGAPFIYGIQEAGQNCRAASMRTVVNAGDFICWMGDNSFYLYNGRVQKIPSDVHDFVFDNINYQYRRAATGGHNQLFSEVWWFFPSGESTVPNKYIIWNYKEQHWSIGELDRSFWIDQGVFDYPISGDSTGLIYEHETNTLQGSHNIGTAKPFCKTGAIEIGNGDRLMQVNQIIPDGDAKSLLGYTIKFKGRQTPLGAETDFGAFTFEADGYQDCRFTSRQVNFEVEGDIDQDFEVGVVRLDARQRGRR